METHIYKHHWRHGHHHHKDKVFYGLMAMLFFTIITLGVVASIYYSLASLDRSVASKNWESYKSTNGYAIKYPSGMKPDLSIPGEVAVGYPDQKWTFAVSTQPNSKNQTLDQVAFDVKTELANAGGNDSDVRVTGIRLNGVGARRVSVSNFEDIGETVLVAIKDGNIYLVRGSTGQSFTTPDNDVLNFASQFTFTN